MLGFDALHTGKTILPLSVSLFVFALGGSALTGRFSPKLIVKRGLAALLVGEVVLLYFLGPDLATSGFAIGMALIGAGLGLLASQVGNVIMSSVDSSRGSEAGGLQGTSLNLGASLGVALVGSIVIGMLATNFTTAVLESPSLPDNVKQQVPPPPRRARTSSRPLRWKRLRPMPACPPIRPPRSLRSTPRRSSRLSAGLAFLALFALLRWRGCDASRNEPQPARLKRRRSRPRCARLNPRVAKLGTTEEPPRSDGSSCISRLSSALAHDAFAQAATGRAPWP